MEGGICGLSECWCCQTHLQLKKDGREGWSHRGILVPASSYEARQISRTIVRNRGPQLLHTNHIDHLQASIQGHALIVMDEGLAACDDDDDDDDERL